MRRKYGLRTPDAIQLATAMESNTETFITNDDRFKKIPHSSPQRVRLIHCV